MSLITPSTRFRERCRVDGSDIARTWTSIPIIITATGIVTSIEFHLSIYRGVSFHGMNNARMIDWSNKCLVVFNDIDIFSLDQLHCSLDDIIVHMEINKR